MRFMNLYRSLCGLVITIVSLQSAFAQTTTTETLTFDNNQLPSGWSYFKQSRNGAGNNLTIQNQRLEIGQVDTYGGISKAFNPAGVTRIQVEYDANIADVFWGQGSAALLMKDPTGSTLVPQLIDNDVANFNAQTPPFDVVTAGMKKNGYNESVMTFWTNTSTTSASSTYYSNPQPAAFGDYHFTAIFEDGQITQTARNIATGETFSSGVKTVPGFLLSSMPNIALYGWTTTGTSAWIDNATVTITTAVPEPETYAMLLAGLGLIGAIGRRRRSGNVLKGNPCES